MSLKPSLRIRKNAVTDIVYIAHARVNAVAKPSAQIDKLCTPRTADETRLTQSICNLINSKSIAIHDRAITELLFLNGCRISEVLSFHYSAIDACGNIMVSVSKSNQKRILISCAFKEYWINYKKNQCDENKRYNRFYFYRLFKKYGIVLSHNSKKHNSVCHAFRHLLLSAPTSESKSQEALKSFIRHKNINSTKYYNERK
jgi:site-specific recombinase XerC